VRPPEDLEVLFNYPVYVPQFPHQAAQYEDWGEIRPLSGCTVTFASVFIDDSSTPMDRAIRNYGCISVDTYSGSSGAPVFIRTVDDAGIHYDLVGIVTRAIDNDPSVELKALRGEGLIPQGCGPWGYCNLMRVLGYSEDQLLLGQTAGSN
jgi:hypothetical protein